jgi:O-antigen ligase
VASLNEALPRSVPPLRLIGWREALAVAVPVGLLAAGAALLGTLVHPLIPLLLVPALALGVLAVLRPILTLYVALALTPLEALYLNIGVLITPGEALLTLTAVAWLLKRAAAKQPIIIRSSLTAPFVAGLVLVPTGFLISETPFAVFKFLALWTVFFLLVQMVLAEGDQRTIRRVVIAVAVAGAAFGAIAIATNGGQQEVSEFGRQATGRARAGFGSPNRLGEFLAMAIPCQIALIFRGPPKLRWPMLLAVAMSTAGLAMTLSRGALVGIAGAFLLLLAWRSFRRAFLIVAPIVLVATVMGLHPPGRVISLDVVFERVTSIRYESGLNPRRVAYRNVPDVVADHPLLGVGAGSLESVAGRYGLIVERLPLNNAHNVFLHIAAERGLISLAVFLWLLFAIARVLFQACRFSTGENQAYAFAIAAAWLSLMLEGMVDNVLEQDAIAGTALVLAACGAVLAREAAPAPLAETEEASPPSDDDGGIKAPRQPLVGIPRG